MGLSSSTDRNGSDRCGGRALVRACLRRCQHRAGSIAEHRVHLRDPRLDSDLPGVLHQPDPHRRPQGAVRADDVPETVCLRPVRGTCAGAVFGVRFQADDPPGQVPRSAKPRRFPPTTIARRVMSPSWDSSSVCDTSISWPPAFRFSFTRFPDDPLRLLAELRVTETRCASRTRQKEAAAPTGAGRGSPCRAARSRARRSTRSQQGTPTVLPYRPQRPQVDLHCSAPRA